MQESVSKKNLMSQKLSRSLKYSLKSTQGNIPTRAEVHKAHWPRDPIRVDEGLWIGMRQQKASLLTYRMERRASSADERLVASQPARALPGESFWSKARRLSAQPIFFTVQAFLNKIPFRPVQIGRFYILQLDQITQATAPRIRGRGEVRKATPDDIEGLVRCEDKREVFM